MNLKPVAKMVASIPGAGVGLTVGAAILETLSDAGVFLTDPAQILVMFLSVAVVVAATVYYVPNKPAE